MILQHVKKIFPRKELTSLHTMSRGHPLWSCSGRDIPDHNRTKIGRIRTLTYFRSAMFGMHLTSRNIEKFP